MKELARDNVYNNENDFDSAFTWTVYGNDSGDWLWDSEEQYIGVCVHRGGDVRGNYGMPRFFRVGDCIADTGFIDWTVSWYCESGPDEGMIEKINEECSIGYTSHPTSHLCDLLGTEDCEWKGVTATVTTEDGGEYVLSPTYYGGGVTDEVIGYPLMDGGGWLHDAVIDTEAWLEAVLCAGDAEEITDTVQELMDLVHGNQADWDNSEGVAEALAVIDAIDSNSEQGATAKIIDELNSEISQELPEEVRKSAEKLHEGLRGLIDRVRESHEIDIAEAEELIDEIG